MRRKYRRLTVKERRFLERHGHRVRREDLAVILGRTTKSAEHLRWRYSRRVRVPYWSLATAKEIFMHGAAIPDIRLAYDRLEASQKDWEEWQITDLKCRVGKEPLKEIARDLKRSQVATRYKAIREGLGVTMYTISRLAKMLQVPILTVEGWTRRSHGRSGAVRVRKYKEGRFTVIHKDDAEWLIEHKGQARRGEFEEHPGKLHEFKDVDDE